MALSAGDIIFQIKGDITGLNQAMNAASASAQKNFGAISRTAGVAMTAAGAAITGFAATSVFSYAQAGDEIQKMALKTGFSTEKLSELRHAAEQGGASFEAIGKASKRLATTIHEAGQGTETYTDALGFLGLKYEDLAGLSAEEQFMKVSLALADVSDASTRAAIAQEIFGRSGVDLLPMLANGSAGLQQMAAEAHRLGIVFDQEGANSAAAFNDALDFLKKSMVGLMYVVAESLVPVLTDLARWVGDAIIGFRAWADEHPLLASAAVKVGVAIGGIMTVLGPLLIMLPGLVAAFTAVSGALPIAGAALLALTGPVGWVIAGVAALGLAAYAFVDDWGAVWEQIKNITKMAIAFVVDHFQPLFDAIGWALDGIDRLRSFGATVHIPGGENAPPGGYRPNRNRGFDARGGGDGSAGGGGLGGITINVNGAGDPHSVSQMVAQALRVELAARGFA